MWYAGHLAQTGDTFVEGRSAGGKEGRPGMRGPRMRVVPGLAAAMILGVLWQAALVHLVSAQEAQASAELRGVVGRVEILRKGQTQWLPAVVGGRLVEGDGIRAFSGASAELLFPDASTVVLAENSRLLLSKVEFDKQQQSRLVLLHLVVGKLRAVIAQTAITLARARQSNFAISTPTAVAAARGTVVWVFTDGLRSNVAVQADRSPFPGKVECITLAAVDRKNQVVLAGSFSKDCSATEPIPPLFLTLSNTATAGAANLSGPVVAPTAAAVLALVVAPAPSAPVNPVGAQTTTPAPPSLGVNSVVFSPPPPRACATDPCN